MGCLTICRPKDLIEERHAMNTSTVINRLRFALLIGALLFVLTSLVHGAVEDHIEKTFTVNDGGKLIMDGDRGSKPN